jgi:hypothetical protein
MNKFDLNATLKAAKVPEISATDRDDLSREVLAQLRREPALPHIIPRRTHRVAWGFALATTCLVMTFALGYWRGHAAASDTLQNAKVIREMLAMFPNRVRAIVEDRHGLNLILSETADIPASSPLYVRICDGKQCSSFVTFSGQEIQVDGQKVTVLADAQGGIILTGNQFVWSNTERTYAGRHLKIEAKNLGLAAM